MNLHVRTLAPFEHFGYYWDQPSLEIKILLISLPYLYVKFEKLWFMYQSMVTSSVRLMLKDVKSNSESIIKMVVLTLNISRM
jgi:hypothetical protein